MMTMMMMIVVILMISMKGTSADDIPQQVHIALAGSDANGNSDRMSISWQTNDNTKTSLVMYGEASGVYTFNASGVSSSYYETYDHHVKTDVLKSNTKYYYRVGDEIAGFSNEMTFTSAKTASSTRGGFSFAVFADLGVVNGKNSNDYITSIKGYADDSFLHPGCYVKFCYESTFNEYMNNIQPWASQVPYLVAPGNHEADCHDPACFTHKERREKLSNFTAYNSRFMMPSEESEGVLNMHYSFNYANVHFISIDTETGYPGAAEEEKYVFPCGGFGGGVYKDQLSWLEADLIKANKERATRPWIFVQGHHPMYQGASVNTEFQAAMESLFFKYGVDVYFSGHVHSYERDYPTYNNVTEKSDDLAAYNNPKATTYIMIGGSGNDEMKNAKRRVLDEGVVDNTPKNGQLGSTWKESDDNGQWTAVVDNDGHTGIGKVTVIDDSNMKFEYVRTSSGEVFDSFTITRDHSVYL